MRVSITDRCDLRCRYCMPEGCDKVPMSQILTYEEIVRICEEKKIPLYLTPKANHSLECGKVKKDIKTIRETMQIVEEFL